MWQLQDASCSLSHATACHWNLKHQLQSDLGKKANEMPVDHVYLQAPYGGEIREVEATPDVLVPLLVQGWYQVPAPADREPVASVGIIKDAE